METTKTDVYTIVTNRIIAQLEKNIVPWQKPWTEAGYPQNLITKIPYRGMNVWMLASLGYSQNYFLTWKQIKGLEGSVRKGEIGHIVVFWKQGKKDEKNPDAKVKPILRYYMVYNIEQCDHIPEVTTVPSSPYPVSMLGACEEIIERMPNCPKIKHSKQKAYYQPTEDYINMPKQQTFKSSESYYSTLFHELIHSTGHASRLNRKGVVDNPSFDTDSYAQEELVAEIGACFLNTAAGIATDEFDNNVAYIQHWLAQLKKHNRIIVYASIQAQRAVEYILNVKPYERTELVPEQLAVETP